MLTGNFLLALLLGIGLLKMKSWSRWVSIVGAGAALLFVPHEVNIARGTPDLIRAAVRTLFFVWVIWYLYLPQVKAAFLGQAQPLTGP